MTQSIIIHSYNYTCGGIGDLLRSIISFYTICQNNNIPFYINFNNIPLFNACFETLNYPIPLNKTIKSYNIIGDYGGTVQIQSIIQYALQNENEIIVVYSNKIMGGINTYISKSISTLSTVLRPSIIITNKIQELYKQYNLTEKHYFSFHLRCGDKYISTESHVGLSTDIRTHINEDNIIYYDNLIKTVINKYKITLPIVIHSDSYVLKDKLKALNSQYIYMDIDIQHVCNNLGKNTAESYISTVSEFYILSQSCGIIMPYYSGFSYMAAVIGDVPLYIQTITNRDKEIISILGPSSVIQI